MGASPQLPRTGHLCAPLLRIPEGTTMPCPCHESVRCPGEFPWATQGSEKPLRLPLWPVSISFHRHRCYQQRTRTRVPLPLLPSHMSVTLHLPLLRRRDQEPTFSLGLSRRYTAALSLHLGSSLPLGLSRPVARIDQKKASRGALCRRFHSRAREESKKFAPVVLDHSCPGAGDSMGRRMFPFPLWITRNSVLHSRTGRLSPV